MPMRIASRRGGHRLQLSDCIVRALASTCMGLSVSSGFCGASSVAAKTTWWVDRLDLSEVKIADCLQRVGEGAVPEVRW
jgi:hypothetical protein